MSEQRRWARTGARGFRALIVVGVLAVTPPASAATAAEAAGSADSRAPMSVAGPSIDTGIPAPSGPDETGGAIVAAAPHEAVSVHADGAGIQVVALPAWASAPERLAAALIQVTASGSDETATVAIPGRGEILVVRPGERASASALAPAGRSVRLATSAVMDITVKVVAWIENDARTYVPDGGIGIAPTVARRVEEPATGRRLSSAAGLTVQLTGLGGIPTSTSAVLAEATIASDEAGELQASVMGGWRPLSATAAGSVFTQLLLIPVGTDGSVVLRATRPMSLTLRTVGWLSVGKPWLGPDTTGGVVAVRPTALPFGTADGVSAVALPDLPTDTNVTALVTGQAFGTGDVRIDAVAKPGTRRLGASGTTTGLVLVPQAQDGVVVSTDGRVAAHAQVVGYVRTTPERAPRATPRALSMDDTGGAVSVTLDGGPVLDRRENGFGRLSGRVTAANGIQSVAVNVPGYPTFFASVDHLRDTFVAELVLPEGTVEVTVVATDSTGALGIVRRELRVEAPSENATFLAPTVHKASSTDLGSVRRVGPTSIVTSAPLPVRAGDVLLTDPFARSATGLSRVVTAVQQRGRSLVYMTRPATLTEVFSQASIGSSPSAPTVASGALRPRLAVDLQTTPVELPYELTVPVRQDLGVLPGLTGTASASIGVSGTARLSMRANHGFFTTTLDHFEASVDSTVAGEVSMNARYTDGGALKAKIGEISAIEVPLVVAGVPFVVRVPVQVFVKVGGTAGIDASFSKTVAVSLAYDATSKAWAAPVFALDDPLQWRMRAQFTGDTGIGADVGPSISVAELVSVSAPVELTAIAVSGTASIEASQDEPLAACSSGTPLRASSGIGISLRASIAGLDLPLVDTRRAELTWLTC